MGKKKSAAPPAAKEITIDYIKGNFFRVVHADGVWGGLTGHGDIHMDFWSERPAIPQRIRHEITDEMRLGKQLEVVKRCDVVREVEVEVVMGLGEAMAFRSWLDDKIRAARELLPRELVNVAEESAKPSTQDTETP